MEIIKIYKCLCDEVRLRILNLVMRQPLCVSDLQSILEIPQVKVSKHLSYMKKQGVVINQRLKNRVYYSVPPQKSVELEKNLCCLQDSLQEYPVFKRDLARLEEELSKSAKAEELTEAHSLEK